MRTLILACIVSSSGCARVVAPAPVPAPPAPVVVAEPPADEVSPVAAQRIAAAHPSPVFLDPARRARLEAALPAVDAYLQQVVARDHHVGLAAGVVIDGELAWFRGYGHRDRERGLPVERDTVFGIGSITKTFTALAALRLRDEGRLDLDRPASTYLAALDTLVYPTADSPRLSIRHLLTHTSGLPRNGYFGADQVQPPLRAAILASLDGPVLEHPPGERHVYSNLAFQVLGLLVGEVTGGDHRAYIRDAILAPLGMNHTAWRPEDVPEDRLALPYEHASGQWRVLPPSRFGDADAAGALLSSVEDLARFAAYNLAAWPPRNEPEVGPLRRASLREAHTLGSFISFRARSMRDAPARGGVNGIGLGFVTQSNCRHDHIVMHNGQTTTYRASLHMLPSRGVAVILLSNVGAGDGLALPNDGLKVLDLLADTGALEPRALAPPDVLLAAAGDFGALVGSWDEAAYARRFSAGFRAARPTATFAPWLGTWGALVGSCRAPRVVTLQSPRSGTLELTCDRGGLRVDLTVVPDGSIVSLNLRGATGLVPAPSLARVAERVLKLQRRWNEREFRSLFTAEFDAEAMRRVFADAAADHGRCRLGPPRLVGLREAGFVLNCEHGAPNLDFGLSETEPAKIDRLELREERRGACQ